MEICKLKALLVVIWRFFISLLCALKRHFCTNLILFQTDKIRETMTKVLQEARDEDLVDKVDSFKAKSTDLIAFMESIGKKKINENMLPFIAVKTEQASAVGVLPILRKRIHKHRKSKDPAEARRAFDFSVMYAQLVTLQELALTQVIVLLKADNPIISLTYANTKNGIIERSRNALSFWHNPKPEHAGSLVHYYPLGSSENSKLLRGFLKRVKVPESEEWNPASYLLISVKWPTWHLKYEAHGSGGRVMSQSTNYLSFSRSTATGYEKIIFEKRPDGYFTLKSGNGRYAKYAYVEDPENPKYIVQRKRHPADDKNHHFIVISYPGTDIITISCRNWPYKFFGGESNKFSVILSNGNVGQDVQYYTHTCLREEPGRGSYNCPEYTIQEK